MPTPRLEKSKRIAVINLHAQGFKNREIAKKVGVAIGSVSNVLNELHPADIPIQSDKKVGKFEWRKWKSWIKDGQALRHEASWSQEHANIKLGDGSSPVILYPFSDQHVGAWGADYDLLEQITDEILRTPNVYMAIIGDYNEFAIKMRNVMEVTSQVITPRMQVDFLEDWLMEVKPRVAFATWCNHGVEREEVAAGSSSIERVLSRHTVYHNGIAHNDIQVGKQVYKIAANHVFKQGRSTLHPCAAQMRYMRFQGIDREICMQGDTHNPGMIQYRDGNIERCALNAGSLHTNSGYAKRYFSLFTAPIYPCVVLRHDEHKFLPFWSLADAIKYAGIKQTGKV